MESVKGKVRKAGLVGTLTPSSSLQRDRVALGAALPAGVFADPSQDSLQVQGPMHFHSLDSLSC